MSVGATSIVPEVASAISGGGSSGGNYSDFASLPGIHYGAGFWNAADPLDILGHSGSNIGANLTNPLGSGLINGNIPNNGVNPLESQRWAGAGQSAPTTLPAPSNPANIRLPGPMDYYTPMPTGAGPFNSMAAASANLVPVSTQNPALMMPVNPQLPSQGTLPRLLAQNPIGITRPFRRGVYTP